LGLGGCLLLFEEELLGRRLEAGRGFPSLPDRETHTSRGVTR